MFALSLYPMNLQQAQNIFDTFQNVNVDAEKKNWCDECDLLMLDTGAGFCGCPLCGACDCLTPDFVAHELWVKKQSPYKRRLYCIEKLKLLAGHKQSSSPMYNVLVKRLKKYKVKSLVEMKQRLKDMGQRRYYKYNVQRRDGYATDSTDLPTDRQDQHCVCEDGG